MVEWLEREISDHLEMVGWVMSDVVKWPESVMSEETCKFTSGLLSQGKCVSTGVKVVFQTTM